MISYSIYISTILATIFIIFILLYILFRLNKKISVLKKQAELGFQYEKFIKNFPSPVFYKKNNKILYTNPSFDISFGINKNKTMDILIKLLKQPLEQLELEYDNNIPKRSIILTNNILDDNHNNNGLIGTIFDIDKFKKDIVSLIDLKQRYSLAVDNSGYGLWDWNISEDKFYCSDNCNKIMGYGIQSKQKNLNSWLSIVDSKDMAKVNEALNKHLSGNNTIFDIEHRIKLDSSFRWINIVGKATFGADKKANRMAGLIIDITKRKKHEALILKKQEFFRDFIDNLPGIAYIKESHGRFIYVNKSFEALLGFKDWKNKTPYDIFDTQTAKQIVMNDKKAFLLGQVSNQEILPNSEGREKIFQSYRFTIYQENKKKLLYGFGIEQ